MPCMAKDCNTNIEELLITLDDGHRRTVVCPNHLPLFAGTLFEHPDVDSTPSQLEAPVDCELCGHPGLLYQDFDAKFHLCESHLRDLIRHRLSPADFHALFRRVGNVFMLHGDFYDPETGEALQPVD